MENVGAQRNLRFHVYLIFRTLFLSSLSIIFLQPASSLLLYVSLCLSRLIENNERGKKNGGENIGAKILVWKKEKEIIFAPYFLISAVLFFPVINIFHHEISHILFYF